MADPGIKNLHQLNSAMDEGPNRCVGFLSEADFRSVHSSISGHTKPIYPVTTNYLYAAMEGKKSYQALQVELQMSTRVYLLSLRPIVSLLEPFR